MAYDPNSITGALVGNRPMQNLTGRRTSQPAPTLAEMANGVGNKMPVRPSTAGSPAGLIAPGSAIAPGDAGPGPAVGAPSITGPKRPANLALGTIGGGPAALLDVVPAGQKLPAAPAPAVTPATPAAQPAGPSFAETNFPNLKTYAEGNKTAVADAYKKGGVGAAAGQTIRSALGGMAAIGTDAVEGIGGAVKDIIDPLAAGAEQLFTGDTATTRPKPAAATATAPAPAATPVATARPAAVATAPATAPVVNPMDTPAAANVSNPAQLAADQARYDQEQAAYKANPQPQTMAAMAAAPIALPAPAVAPLAKFEGGSAAFNEAVNAKRARNQAKDINEANKPMVEAALADRNLAARGAQQTQLAEHAQQLKQNDPLAREQLTGARMTNAGAKRVSELQAKLVDPATSEKDREQVAESLRQLAGKEDSTKIAPYSEIGPDGMSITQNSVIVKGGQPQGTARDYAAGIAAKNKPAVAPQQAHIDMLKKNAKDPKYIAAFNAKFGAGAAEKLLGIK